MTRKGGRPLLRVVRNQLKSELTWLGLGVGVGVGVGVGLGLERQAGAHQRGHEAVGPLLGDRVDLAVELPHRDALRVEQVPLGHLVLRRLLAVALELCERGAEDLRVAALAWLGLGLGLR